MFNTYSAVGSFMTGMTPAQIAGYFSLVTANTEV